MQKEQEQDIYILKDPRDSHIRYVGRSSDPEKRFRAHISSAPAGDEKREWLSELRSLGLIPILEIIDHAHSHREAVAKETSWVHRYTQEGAILLNSVCAKKREWDRYMAKIAEDRKAHNTQQKSTILYYRPLRCPCCSQGMRLEEKAYYLTCECNEPHQVCQGCRKCVLHCICKEKAYLSNIVHNA